jgi:hypothetical protein
LYYEMAPDFGWDMVDSDDFILMLPEATDITLIVVLLLFLLLVGGPTPLGKTAEE